MTKNIVVKMDGVFDPTAKFPGFGSGPDRGDIFFTGDMDNPFIEDFARTVVTGKKEATLAYRRIGVTSEKQSGLSVWESIERTTVELWQMYMFLKKMRREQEKNYFLFFIKDKDGVTRQVSAHCNIPENGFWSLSTWAIDECRSGVQDVVFPTT